MSALRACIRLWIVGSVSWIAYWSWNYAANCLRMNNGRLWCPSTGMDGLVPTNYLKMIWTVAGVPLAAFIAGLLCLWAIRATRRELGSR